MPRSKTFCLAVALVLVAGTAGEARVSHGYSGIFSLDTATTVGDDASGPPQATVLSSIYPNPFNPRTTIEFELAQDGLVDLTIFDPRGRLIRSLEQGPRPIGHHRATWDGCDNAGRAVPTGIYFCRLRTPWGAQTKQLVLAR